MLAKNEGYARVEAGEISEIERAALLKVRDKLLDGTLPKQTSGAPWPEGTHFFDMLNWFSKLECGTAGCIAGSAYVLSQEQAFNTIFVNEPNGWITLDDGEFNKLPIGLRNLFLPGGIIWLKPEDYSRPENAAAAITAYLNGNDMPWEGIVKTNKG